MKAADSTLTAFWNMFPFTFKKKMHTSMFDLPVDVLYNELNNVMNEDNVPKLQLTILSIVTPKTILSRRCSGLWYLYPACNTSAPTNHSSTCESGENLGRIEFTIPWYHFLLTSACLNCWIDPINQYDRG